MRVVRRIGRRAELRALPNVVLWSLRHGGMRDVRLPSSPALSERRIAGTGLHKFLGLAPVMESVIHVAPRALERDARVKGGQAGAGEDDHDTLENHEEGLILGEELALEAARELDASVYTPDEDCDCGNDEADEEGLEATRADQSQVALVPGVLVAPHAKEKVAGGTRKQHQ